MIKSFTVIDNNTGKQADKAGIALNEEWAGKLMYCDMEGFAILEDGSLILADECGRFEYCPEGRFSVVEKNTMPRYIDADALYRDTEKRIAEAHEARMAVVDDDFLDLINDAYVDEDVVEVVRCKDCNVPRNKWTGCPNLNGMIPPPEFFCAKGVKKQGEGEPS